MKIKIIVIIGALLFALPFAGTAQTRTLLKKKTKTNTVNEKVDKGMSRLGSKLLNAIVKEDNDTTETTAANSEDKVDESENVKSNFMMNMLSKGGADVKHDDSYVFDKSVKWLMEGGENEERTEAYMTSYYNSKTNNIAIEMESLSQPGEAQQMGQIITIMDSKNKCGVLLTSQGGEKMAIITAMDEDVFNDFDEEYEDEISNEDNDNYDFKKTGRSKNILGYKCFEYKYTSNDGKGEYWLTEELDFKMDRQAAEKSGMPMFYDGDQFEGKVMMEMFAYDEEGESVHLLVTEVNTKSKQSFSLAGYNVMKVGAGMEY